MGPVFFHRMSRSNMDHISMRIIYPEIIRPETLERLPDGEVGGGVLLP